MKYAKKLMTGVAIGASSALLWVAPVSALAGTDTVTSDDIVNGTITTADIANDTITYHDIGEAAVRSGEIANNSVTSDDIQAGAVRSSEIANGTIMGGDLASDIQVESAVTRATGATGSFQNLAGDVTYQGAAGGTSFFHAGVMGHFHGAALTNNVTGGVYHAGTIGEYSVITSDANTGPKAGVVGIVGGLDSNDNSTANSGAATAGVMSVIDGDGGVITANAAYGVQYLNSTSGSKFTYGLDLSHAGTGSYAAVTYGTADIRLANGVTILSGTGAPSSSGAASSNCNLGAGKPALPLGSLYLNASGGTSTSLYLCTATNVWTAK